jgi:uncharacterized membrane protein
VWWTCIQPDLFKSEARAVSDAGQVGWGDTGANSHALLWNGTAASVVDLHAFLTHLEPTLDGSVATGISDNGVIVGYAYSRYHLGDSYAVLWTPVPEPRSCALIGCGLVMMHLMSIRRR